MVKMTPHDYGYLNIFVSSQGADPPKLFYYITLNWFFSRIDLECFIGNSITL